MTRQHIWRRLQREPWLPFMFDVAMDGNFRKPGLSLLRDSLFLERCRAEASKIVCRIPDGLQFDELMEQAALGKPPIVAYAEAQLRIACSRFQRQIPHGQWDEARSCFLAHYYSGVQAFNPNRGSYEAYVNRFVVLRAQSVALRKSFNHSGLPSRLTSVSLQDAVGDQGTMQDVLESAYPETMSVAPVCIGMASLSDKPLSAQLGTAVERAIGRDREKAILYQRCVVDGEEPSLVGRTINLSRSRSYEILQQVCEEVLRFVRTAIAEECGVPEDEVFEELIGCFNGPREAATRPAREFHDLLAPPVDTPAPAPQ